MFQCLYSQSSFIVRLWGCVGSHSSWLEMSRLVTFSALVHVPVFITALVLIYSFPCLLSNNSFVAPQVTFVAQIWLSCTLSLRFCTLSVAPKLTLKALGADHLRIYRVLIFSLCSSGVFIPSDLLSLSRSLVFISCLYLLLSIVFISECSSLVYSSNNFLGAVGIILSLCLQHACRSLTTALVSYIQYIQ